MLRGKCSLGVVCEGGLLRVCLLCVWLVVGVVFEFVWG